MLATLLVTPIDVGRTRTAPERPGMNVDRADGGYGAWLLRALGPLPGRLRLRHAIGGDFEAIGTIEAAILRHYGLADEHLLVDVGCGVGRTAYGLQALGFRGRYLGTDVIPRFLHEARRAIASPAFRFARVRRMQIPLPEASADMVCFFSVFTHLLHEHSYLYLQEARRVLKPGGVVVLSFLEFAVPAHWNDFAATVEHAAARKPRTLNVFIESKAIAAWAAHLDLEVLDLHRGDEAWLPLPSPVRFDSGAVNAGPATLGQSVAALRVSGPCHSSRHRKDV